MKYIEELLDELEPMEPIPTGLKANYYRDATIKAVLFDIYGTLLISSSGDIGKAELSPQNMQMALEAGNIKIISSSDITLDSILCDFEYTIKICHQEARKNDIPFPEVDILSIWEIVLIHAKRRKLIAYNGDADIMRLTCTFEFLSNKVYPMPGMQSVVKKIGDLGMPVGIISNAQFYTPVIMNYFLTNTISLNESVQFFDPELTVFSYKLGMSKPDIRLFQELVPVLKKKYQLLPEQILFIGNDKHKDIFGAKQVGFKTALFAGDRRSLRLHSNETGLQSVQPDFVITELPQIEEILGI
jgi:putative hydrolase of the HAD superfamily